jgi:hypothetical protein
MVLRGTGIMQERVPTLSGEMSRTDLRDTLNYVANGASFEGWVAEVERYARKILAEAGHDPERPCGMPTPVEDGSTLAIAHEVLRWIRIARNNIKQGNAADAGFAGIRIGCLVREHDFSVEWEAPALRGKAFIEGPKAPRTDALARLIDDALRQLAHDASTKAILDHVQARTTIVHEVDGEGTVYWVSRGREKKTGLKAFKNRLAARRKRLSAQQGPSRA